MYSSPKKGMGGELCGHSLCLFPLIDCKRICMNVTASARRKNYRTTEDGTLGVTVEIREMTTVEHDFGLH